MNRTRSALLSLGLAACFLGAYARPVAGGWAFHEFALTLATFTLAAWAAGKRVSLGWIYGGFWLGMVAGFHWMPRMLQVMGDLPLAPSLAGLALFAAFEALGPLLALALARALHRRGRPLAAALAGAGLVMAWEALGWHIYPLSAASSLGGVPILARATAFTGTWGAAGLLWAAALWSGLRLAEEDRTWHAWGPLAGLPVLLAILGTAWHALPREARKVVDIVLVQPNYPPGRPFPLMETIGWQFTDEALRRNALPKSDAPTLVLWAESSLLGLDHRGPQPALTEAARQRGVSWLFGTEGGGMNLVRGEGPGQPPMVLGKIHPMPFGERNPGPEALRLWLDRQTNRLSQVPGTLTAASSFEVQGPGGPLRVHPLLCSEALMPDRVLAGLDLAGGDLLTNHTNDGWFEASLATDQHASQIRLRAPETGLPMVRATLTGKSGLFREDGSWELWGEAQTQATRTLRLDWRPVKTPWRSAGYRWALLAAYGLITGWVLFRRA